MAHQVPTATTQSDRALCQILIADDDLALVDILKDDLAGLGYSIQCAYDGNAAIRAAVQYRPNLIILDVNMPLTNGFNALAFLRARSETAKIPVIIISGETTADVYRAIRGFPRVGHITKPFELENINSLVQLFLDQYPTA